jgi:hypothetical protein
MTGDWLIGWNWKAGRRNEERRSTLALHMRKTIVLAATQASALRTRLFLLGEGLCGSGCNLSRGLFDVLQ